jgi:hypothetical protein
MGASVILKGQEFYSLEAPPFSPLPSFSLSSPLLYYSFT